MRRPDRKPGAGGTNLELEQASMNANSRKGQKPKPLPEQLVDTEERIVDLIRRRSRILSELARKRKAKGKSLVDTDQEKKLWEIWKDRGELSGRDEKTLRKVFSLLNDLGYELNEADRDRAFKLRPFTSPAAVDVQGPPDRLASRIWMALASACGREASLAAVWNDPLFELLRALNNAGGELTREEDTVRAFPGPGLAFDGKSIFAGNDPFNLYLLVFLAAREPARCKLTGESGLKQADLQPLFAVLPSLGARGVSLVPGSTGLPMRLEASGAVSDTISVPGNAPAEMLDALLTALIARGGHRPVRVQWPRELHERHDPARVRRVCELVGVTAQLDEGLAELPPGKPDIPHHPQVELDPCLSAYLLALPGLVGGEARLQGVWPSWLREARKAQSLLEGAGLGFRRDSESVQAAAASATDTGRELDPGGSPELSPVAAALAVAAPGCALRPADEEETGHVRQVLDTLRVAYEIEGGGAVRIRSGPEGPFDEIRLRAPGPWWTLGTALLSLARRNIALENPGELASLWPQFWSLFKGLPDPQNRTQAGKREDVKQEGHERRKRRRIVE